MTELDYELEDKKTAGNRRLAKKRVQWLIKHSASYQLLCWVDSLVLRNPLLRQAPKRYRKCLRKIVKPEKVSEITSGKQLLNTLILASGLG